MPTATTTQQPDPAAPITPPQAVAVEKPAAIERQAAAEGSPVVDAATTQLQQEAREKLGKEMVEFEIGSAVVQWFLVYESDLLNPDKQGAAQEQLQKVFAEIHEKYKTDPLIDNLPEATRDLIDIVKSGTLKDFPTETPAGYRDARNEVLVSLMNVMLRGHLNGAVIKHLVSGGINYREVPRDNSDHTVDWVGYFDATTKSIEVYPRLFKIAEGDEVEGKTDSTLLHELAHAMDTADGLLFPNKSLQELAANPGKEQRPDGLTEIEWRTFQRMLTQPIENVGPWLPPYISAMLTEHKKNPPTEPQALQKANYELINETKTEWARIFTQSDGTFGNFMAKLLENCTFVQNHLDKRNQPDFVRGSLLSGDIAKALSDFTNSLDPRQHPDSIEGEIKTFMAAHLKNPNGTPLDLALQQQITNMFLLGSSLFLRFSRLRGKMQLADGRQVDKRDSVATALKDGKYSDTGYFGAGRDTAGVGRTANNKDESIWMVIWAAIVDLRTIRA